MKRVEIAVVTFGPVSGLQNFTTVDQFRPPRLEAAGDTPLGAAVARGLGLAQKAQRDFAEERHQTFPPVGLSDDRRRADR